jgi:predicted thioesterase
VATIESIRPGLEGRLERVVEGDLITTHVGGQGTFSTPAMIGLMEITSHRALDGLLPDGHTTVGYEVHVRHHAPAPPGSTIVVTPG